MSYTNVPCNIIDNEIEILPDNNSNEYQVSSNNFLKCDTDSDDESSIVSRSASRTNEVNLTSMNNAITPSGTNAEKVIIDKSKDVIIGTVYDKAVSINYFFVGKNDLKDNFNLQFSDNPDPVKTTTKQTSKASHRKRIYSFRSERQLIVFIFGSIVLITTIITAGYYLYLLENKLIKSGPTAATNSNDSVKSYQYDPTTTTVTDVDYELIERKRYGAQPPKTGREPLSLPVKRIIICHTATPICKDYLECSDRVCQIQNFHMNERGWDDISYNFLIGGDGRAYEGCGYTVGSHTKNFNEDSIGIAFIGDFTSIEADERQIKTAKRLIEDCVKNNKIHPHYALYGHRQLQRSQSPVSATLFLNPREFANAAKTFVSGNGSLVGCLQTQTL